MAGIFTITTSRDFEEARSKCDELARRMALYPWQAPRIVSVPECGLVMGAVIHELPNIDPGGYCRQEGPLTCVVDGVIRRTREDCGADPWIDAGDYARAAIEAYRKFGPDFVPRIEGSFVVILHDRDRHELVIGNGHAANPHLYMYAHDGESAYCTQLGPLARARFFEPRPDSRAIGHLMYEGGYNHSESLIEGVEALELATVMRHSLTDHGRTSRAYWTFGDNKDPEENRSFRDHVGAVCDALDGAGARIARRKGRHVAGLSGGLDSRLVAAVAAKHIPDLKTWTFGAPDSPDMITAGIISARLGLQQLTWPTRPELNPELSREYALTVDGAISAQFAFGLQRARELMDHADIVLNGLAGEMILGNYMAGPLPKTYKMLAKTLKPWEWLSPERASARRLSGHQIATFISIKAGPPPVIAPFLAHRPRPVYDRTLERLEELAAFVHPRYLHEHHIFTRRVTRWTMYGILSDRHFYGDASLFYDYDVIDRCMAAPLRMKEGNGLYAGVYRTLVPEVADIPNANNGIRPDASPLRSTISKVTSTLKNRISPAAGNKFATGSNAGAWARTLYPDFLRQVLADKSTRERPFWDGPGIADLFEKHVAGEINIGTAIGQLLSIEYFCREWLD